MSNNKTLFFTLLLAVILGFSRQSVASVILHEDLLLAHSDRTQSGPNYDEVFQQMDQRKWQNYSHSSRGHQQQDVKKNNGKGKSTQDDDSTESEKFMENHD